MDEDYGYDYDEPAVATDEMSIAANWTGSSLPGVTPAESDDYADFFGDEDDGEVDYQEQPQLDPETALELQRFVEDRQWQQGRAEWEADYAQRQADIQAAQQHQVEENGRAHIDGRIDAALGHSDSPQAFRDFVYTVADSAYAQFAPALRQQGNTDQDIAAACVETAIQLVRDGQTTAWGLRHV